MTDPRLQQISDLLTLKAEGQYGLSAINQRQHAVQAAWLAEKAGCTDSLITACLLHDVGHMVHDLGDNPAEQGVDDRHEALGYEFLSAWFGPDVTEPVRLHVAAKRYLCATEADYLGKLSRDSVLSLSLQGGPMSAEEVASFDAIPQAGSGPASTLRRTSEDQRPGDAAGRALLALCGSLHPCCVAVQNPAFRMASAVRRAKAVIVNVGLPVATVGNVPLPTR